MRESAWWLRVGAAAAAVILVTIPMVASATQETVAGSPALVAKPDVKGDAAKAAPDEACALLDDPDTRALMDGLLLKLAVMCDRTDLLGEVRQEPRTEIAQTEAGTDVPVNDPGSDPPSGSHTQSETSLAFSEATGTVCSGYNDSTLSGSNNYSGFSRSTDGGATFSDQGGLTSGISFFSKKRIL